MTGIDRREFMGVSAAVLSGGCLHSRNTAYDPPEPVGVDVTSEYGEDVTVEVQVFEGGGEVFSGSASVVQDQAVRGVFEDVVDEAGLYEVEIEIRSSEVLDSGRYYWSVDCSRRHLSITVDDDGNIALVGTEMSTPVDMDVCGEERRVPEEHPKHNDPPFEGIDAED